MAGVHESSDKLAKDFKAKLEEKKKEESDSTERVTVIWKYVDEIRKLQGLELQVEETRRNLKRWESKFPDLKGIRGGIDHCQNEAFYLIDTEDGKKLLAGKSKEEAAEKYKKKLEIDKKNAEKQKELSSKKKQKVGE